MSALTLASSCTIPAPPLPPRFSRFELREPDARRTCTLWYIRRELGRDAYGDQRMVTYVKRLIAECAFPAPLPTLRKTALVRDVVADSVWLRDAVDAWLDAQYPVDVAERFADDARTAAAAAMDARAATLGRPLTLVRQ